MKKRFIAFLLVFCLLSMSSCSYIESIRTMINDIKELNNAKVYGYDENGEEDQEFDRSVIDDIDARFEKLDRMLSENDASRAGAFVATFSLQMRDLHYLSDHSSLAFTRFCTDPTNKEYAEADKELSELLNDRSARLYRMYEPIYNSNYSSLFFESWDEKEIDDAREMSRQYTEEFVGYSDKVDEFIQKYEQLDENSRNYRSDSAELFGSIVSGNRKIAEAAGADSYADYAYDTVYGRDYTPEDVKKFQSYVRDYLIPLGNELLSQIRKYRGISTVQTELAKLDGQNVSKNALKNALTPYYEKLGSKNVDAFNSFLDHYTSASASKARSIAFTYYLNYYEHPACYFGPENQTMLTYVHEQGHYLSFFKSETGINSVDLCETQSQGNEWLYLSYIRSQYDDATYRYLIKYKLLNEILTLVLATCCDAFEQRIYADPAIPYTKYDEVFSAVIRDLGAEKFFSDMVSMDPTEYWHRAIVSNSFYYVSYAVSLVPVFEIYVIASEKGFDAAAEIYNKLTVCNYDAGFVETLRDSGLSSPFSEELYKKISDFFLE